MPSGADQPSLTDLVLWQLKVMFAPFLEWPRLDSAPSLSFQVTLGVQWGMEMDFQLGVLNGQWEAWAWRAGKYMLCSESKLVC